MKECSSEASAKTVSMMISEVSKTYVNFQTKNTDNLSVAIGKIESVYSHIQLMCQFV